MSFARVVHPQHASAFLPFRIPSRALGAMAGGLDLAMLLASALLAKAVYSGPNSLNWGDIGTGAAAALVFLALGKSWGFYTFQTLLAPERISGRVAAASLSGSLAVVCLLFLLKAGAQQSRGVMILFTVLALVLSLAARFAFAAAARGALATGLLRGRRVVLIGEPGELERLTPLEVLNFGLDEVGRFALSRGGALEELAAADRSVVAQAMAAARSRRASEFAVILPWSRDRAISEITSSFRESPLPVRLYPDRRTRDVLLQKRESHFDPYISVELQREPLTRIERLLKRGFDIAVSATALICLAPLMLMTALLIRLDSSGPALFLQTRRGFDNRPFKIWKFRTMTVWEDGPSLRQARREDDRVTRMGRILRRTSVDELPQLVNVLRGDMSIVGPRPHALAHDQEYEARIREYALRRHVKPGLTGAAQIAGLRGETADLRLMEARVERDLWYINNWSLWLDVAIVVRTFAALATHEAY